MGVRCVSKNRFLAYIVKNDPAGRARKRLLFKCRNSTLERDWKTAASSSLSRLKERSRSVNSFNVSNVPFWIRVSLFFPSQSNLIDVCWVNVLPGMSVNAFPYKSIELLTYTVPSILFTYFGAELLKIDSGNGPICLMLFLPNRTNVNSKVFPPAPPEKKSPPKDVKALSNNKIRLNLFNPAKASVSIIVIRLFESVTSSSAVVALNVFAFISVMSFCWKEM